MIEQGNIRTKINSISEAKDTLHRLQMRALQHAGSEIYMEESEGEAKQSILRTHQILCGLAEEIGSMLGDTATLLSECQFTRDNKNPVKFIEEKTETVNSMTDQEERIFLDYGMPEEKIEKMKETGMTIDERAFADTAIIMLAYLQKKYTGLFRVVTGGTPSVFAPYYWIKARACQGLYVNESFKVIYLNGYLWDGYFSIVKQNEARHALQVLLDQYFDNVIALVSADGEDSSGEFSGNVSGRNLLTTYDYTCNIIIEEPEYLEYEFRNEIRKIQKVMETNGINGGCDFYCFTIEVEKSISTNAFYELIQKNRNRDIYSWQESMIIRAR